MLTVKEGGKPEQGLHQCSAVYSKIQKTFAHAHSTQFIILLGVPLRISTNPARSYVSLTVGLAGYLPGESSMVTEYW